jgi:hypothetical protein
LFIEIGFFNWFDKPSDWVSAAYSNIDGHDSGKQRFGKPILKKVKNIS